MVVRMELIKNEIEKFPDMKYIDASNTGYTLQLGIYENSNVDLLLNSLLPEG